MVKFAWCSILLCAFEIVDSHFGIETAAVFGCTSLGTLESPTQTDQWHERLHNLPELERRKEAMAEEAVVVTQSMLQKAGYDDMTPTEHVAKARMNTGDRSQTQRPRRVRRPLR